MKDRFTQLAERWAAENGIKDPKLTESVAWLLRYEDEAAKASFASRMRAFVETLTAPAGSKP